MAAPSIFQIGQYLLDLSFENFVLETTVAPAIQVNVNVEARSLAGVPEAAEVASGDYESVLMLKVTAYPPGADGQVDTKARPMFILELRYGARYRVTNVPMKDVEPFLLIEAPRMLFPFARQVAADSVMQGGLPPLLLAPVDFAELYDRQRRQVA